LYSIYRYGNLENAILYLCEWCFFVLM
jgi:hypothetical protein